MRLTTPKDTTPADLVEFVQKGLKACRERWPENEVHLNDWSRKSGHVATFTLRCESSKAAPARKSAMGRRGTAASWEAHKVFLFALFDACPNARLKTALADYKGVADFVQKYPDTRHHNAGSVMQPAEFGSL